MVNKVTLIGNLGADPEVRRLESGAVVAKLRIATSESYRDKNTGEWQTITEWHNVVLWRNMAERAEKSLKKGSMIYLEGKLTHRSWESEGTTKYITEVVGNYFRNLTKREDQGGGDYSQNQGGFSTPTSNAPQQTSTPAIENPAPAADDDLPF